MNSLSCSSVLICEPGRISLGAKSASAIALKKSLVFFTPSNKYYISLSTLK